MTLNKLFEQTRPLFWCGIVGLVLAAGCGVLAVSRGAMIPPEGDLTKAITFDAAIGLFLITIALVLPLAQFTPKGQARWIRAVVILNLYAYTVETVQTIRGIDPRFTRVGGLADQIFGMIFGIMALGLMTTFLILMIRFWKQPLQGRNALVLLSLRYASAITVLGFGSGFWMSGIQGRHVGIGGNILPLHAIAFHALQAIPLVAWFFTKSKLPDTAARPWVHAAGLTWLGVCAAIAWQTAGGMPVTQFTSAMLAAYALAMVWTLSLARSVRATLA